MTAGPKFAWHFPNQCCLTRARYSVRLTSVLSMNLVVLFKYPSSLLARKDCFTSPEESLGDMARKSWAAMKADD